MCFYIFCCLTLRLYFYNSVPRNENVVFIPNPAVFTSMGYTAQATCLYQHCTTYGDQLPINLSSKRSCGATTFCSVCSIVPLENQLLQSLTIDNRLSMVYPCKTSEVSSYDIYIILRDFSYWLERGIDAPCLAMVSHIFPHP